MEYLKSYEIADEYQMAMSSSPELPTEFREMLVTAASRTIYYHGDKTVASYDFPILSRYDSDTEIDSTTTETTCPSITSDEATNEALYDEEQSEMSQAYPESQDDEFYYYDQEEEDYYTRLCVPGAPKPSDAGRYRLPACHWALERFPDIFDDEDEDDLPPTIMVTTPEGETLYPTDYTRYGWGG